MTYPIQFARRRASTRKAANERGATIVEFALTFTLFIMIILGLLELGRGMWVYSTVAHGARQGGRFSIVHGTEGPTTLSEILEKVKKSCIGLERDNIRVSVVWNPDSDTPKLNPANAQRGDIVEVTVSYPLRLVTSPIILAGNTLTLSSRSRMVVAN